MNSSVKIHSFTINFGVTFFSPFAYNINKKLRNGDIISVELILINTSKLKIMLTPDDMKKYSLDIDKMNYDNTETRRVFWNILDTAKHETGFDAASDRVCIQVYPSKGGGCEMYVTKLGSEKHERTEEKALGCITNNEEMPCDDTYVFETLSELLQFCHSASMSGFSGESNLYTDGKRYYLTFTQKCEKVPCGEFAKKVRSTFAKQYFAERCKVICKTDAIAKMASFA